MSGQPPPSEQKRHHTPDEEDDRRGRGGGRGRGRGRGRGKGRGGGGPDESDDDMPPPNMPRPSGPASLFDFFDVKMHEKKGKVLISSVSTVIFFKFDFYFVIVLSLVDYFIKVLLM